jgi:hypothetical protein
MLQLRQGEQTVKAPIDILGLYSGANSEIAIAPRNRIGAATAESI